jgi:AraC-like DNA-binding protein
MMFEFLLVLEGRVKAVHGMSEQVLEAGDLALISPMQLHGYEVRHEEGASFFAAHVQIEEAELLHLFETENRAFYPGAHELNETLKPWISMLMDDLQEKPLRSTRVMLRVLNIMDCIQRYFGQQAVRSRGAELREPAHLIAREIERLLRRTDRNGARGNEAAAVKKGTAAAGSDWLEEISRQLNISRRHCHRLFHQAYGMSPRQYLMILKQQEAMQMLGSTSDTVEAIAYRLGYVNVQSFSRQFAAWVGCTPGSFRKQRPESANFLPPSLG